MATVQTNLMTAEQFHDWATRPENRGRNTELVRGEIVEMPPPGKMHGLVCANVSWVLGNYVRQRGKGYVCSNDTGLILSRNPDTVRGPDILLFEDAARLEEVGTGYGERPPTLAVEILSPNDTTGRVMRRVRDQLRFGTRLLWVLDPDARNVVVYRPGKEDYLVEEEEELTGEDVLPDFRCRVGEFFNLPAAS